MDVFQLLGTVGGVLGLSAAVPTIILFLLGRKGANKKLEIEQGALTVDQFNAALPAYKDLLNRADAAAKVANDAAAVSQLAARSALDELQTYKAERESILSEVKELRQAKEDQGEELTKTNSNLEKLRALFTSYVARVGIPLTREEEAIFEDTKPILRRARRK